MVNHESLVDLESNSPDQQVFDHELYPSKILDEAIGHQSENV